MPKCPYYLVIHIMLSHVFNQAGSKLFNATSGFDYPYLSENDLHAKQAINCVSAAFW
jgi:hypothetical protein